MKIRGSLAFMHALLDGSITFYSSIFILDWEGSTQSLAGDTGMYCIHVLQYSQEKTKGFAF